MDFIEVIELKHVFLCSLFILGLNGLFLSGNILYPIAHWLNKPTCNNKTRMYEYIQKPLFRCAFCMSSFWGTIWYFLFVKEEVTWDTFFMWPLFCILVAGTIRLFMFIGNYDISEIE